MLVVDDEPHIGLILRPHLEHQGHRVTLARTLAQARATPAESLDVILLDVHLPDGSGLDWLRELRSAPQTQALPVLVLTGEGEDRVLETAGGLGAIVLTKPFSPSKLTARIAALLRAAGPGPSPSPA